VKQITINHVFSNDVHSLIFEDLLAYFREYGQQFIHTSSIKPLCGALIRHYHRPNVESSLVCPAVVTVHHDLRETDDWLHFKNYESQYRQANLIICLNSSQQAYLHASGIDHTVVIPHGFNPRFLEPVKRNFDGERKIRIGVFSRRYPRKVKGEAYLQELLKHLDPDHFSFLLIGQDRGIDARVARQLGFAARSYERIPYSVLCDAYRAIDVLLIPSRFEGGPANVPEAVATATPMLASRVGMALDFMRDQINGYFLSMEPAIDAQRLEALHSQPERLNNLFSGSQACTGMAKSWRNSVESHESHYRTLVNSLLENA
jgi:glycosyltransferase involved in cell wall biosynthesis